MSSSVVAHYLSILLNASTARSIPLQHQWHCSDVVCYISGLWSAFRGPLTVNQVHNDLVWKLFARKSDGTREYPILLSVLECSRVFLSISACFKMFFGFSQCSWVRWLPLNAFAYLWVLLIVPERAWVSFGDSECLCGPLSAPEFPENFC